MPTDQPRLDRTSLARLGIELQAKHHLSEKAPLTDQQKDLLLQWAVAEAITAAQDEGAAGRLLPLEPPHAPQPIASAPRAPDGEPPRVLLLYAPHPPGWYTGFWSGGRWRTALGADVDLQPTHWLPPLAGPASATGEDAEPPDPKDWR